MQNLLRWGRTSLRTKPIHQLCFPTSGFAIIDDDKVVEEETFESFKNGQYYPVNIGDVFTSRYQVVGKLGFGTTSTVWLARDLEANRHVSLKVYTRGQDHREEFQIYQYISKVNPSHRGYRHVRTAIETLSIPREGGDHSCMVQKPMWESLEDLLYRTSDHRFSEKLLRGSLELVLLGLEYLHSECKLVHTDIKAENILQEIADESILEAFTTAELTHPSPRKFVQGMPIYLSRTFEWPKVLGTAVLSDLGEAVRGDQKRSHNAQPNIYRSPEVMLQAEWSYPADIWNVGAMVWDLFQGKHMFRGDDPDGKGYSTRAHLAELIGLLGPPPADLLHRGKRSPEFFAEDGAWKADILIPSNMSLVPLEGSIEEKNKEMFLTFMRSMLQWRPEDRKTASELLEDPWLRAR